MAQEGMWEYVGLQRGSVKSEGDHNTRRKRRCWESHNLGEGALGRKDRGGMARAASGGEIPGGRGTVLGPPPGQTCCEGSGGREEGESQVRCLMGQGRAGRPKGGLVAGPEEPGPALRAVWLQALAWRRPGAGPGERGLAAGLDREGLREALQQAQHGGGQLSATSDTWMMVIVRLGKGWKRRREWSGTVESRRHTGRVNSPPHNGRR